DIGGRFNLDVSDVAQRGTLFIRTSYHQDGLENGQFVRHEITQDGTILGHFSSGAIRSLYRIPVATFINPNALTAVSNTMFQQSAESGGPQLRGPGDDLVHLIPNAVEQSNVDISDGFTQMIITQRAYSSSAQVVRTIDEMTMVVRDLKR
ncbi:MAG: flagellar hook-basal body complex protein, partial [Proteobacteria bacterium]|nr:flagellar hook-basal body complex protein [Pseudomonadota bacterium]